jgi:hypothetical protein
VTHPTLLHWLPVDDQGNEIDHELDPGGNVTHVPAIGDTVLLAACEWVVVRRLWIIPVPHEQAPTPRQAVTLHIRKATR